MSLTAEDIYQAHHAESAALRIVGKTRAEWSAFSWEVVDQGMLGAPAEEKFSDRVDRLAQAIGKLNEAFSKLAPQAALDALATAFTEEMAKVKDEIAALHRGGRVSQ